MEFPPGKEKDLCNMILDCCAQQRTYEKFYGLLAGRFALLKKEYMEAFEAIFCDQYETIHRLETNKLRNVAKMFAHLLYTDAIPWTVLENVVLSEEMTTSSSRIFVKVLFQELCEYMGLPRLNERLKDVTLQPFFEGLFPRDNPRNTRFAINFFTSIGLGGLTDELREYRKNAPQLIMAQRQCIESEKDDDSSSDSSSSSSSSDSSDSSSSSSSSDSSSSDSESSSESSSTDSSDSNSDQLHKKKDKKKLREIGHKERTGGKDVQEPRRDEDCSGRRSSRTNQDSSKHEMDESHGNPYCVNGTHRRGRGSAERSTCIDSEGHSSRRDKIRHTGDRLQHNDQDTRAKKPHSNEEGRDEDKGRNYYGGVREREREKHGNYHQDKFQRVRRQDFRDRSELERKGTSYRQEQDNNEGNGERNMEYRSRHENADRHRNRKQNTRKRGEEYDTDEELKGMQIDREVRKDKYSSSDSCSEDDTRKKHRSQRTMDKNEDTLRDQKRQRDVEGKKCNDFDERQKQKHRKRDDLVGNEESGTESEGRNKRRHRSGDREKSWQRETQKKKIDRERQHQVHSEDENRKPAKNKRYSMEKEGQSNVGRFREDKDVRKVSVRERDRREHSRKDKRDRPENDGGLRRDSRGRRERDDERKDTDHHDRRQSLEQSKLRCRDGSHEQDGDRRRPKERSIGQKHHKDRSRDRDDGSESPRRR
uniref:CWC22 spliceosome associated protein homolog n=3 Tax=Eptatretus burgeri TaxID=7764 RepID=A0A8C4QT82_EPTBU